jgi:pimeloyl-ACP methyl ester carboxylesterase
LLVQAGSALAADKAAAKPQFKTVQIKTVDSVELQGTFFPAVGGNKQDYCVLLLHTVHPRNGGSSHDEPWDEFAGSLQQAGFDVLSFDFRGFGSSTGVGEEFWDGHKFPYNQLIRNARNKPSSINFKDFPPQYYANLVNDIAAARAYLDRRNDQRETNSSNIVLIGAGEGATLGLLWMASECRLQRDSASDQLVQVTRMLDEPEGRDLACGIWLNISPTVGSRGMPVRDMVKDVAAKGKVRSVFMYSKTDTQSAMMAKGFVDSANQAAGRKVTLSKDVAGAGKLWGNKLLGESTDASKWIIETCLKDVVEGRGTRERRSHDGEKYNYFWSFPWPNASGVHLVPAKLKSQTMILPVPTNLFLGR